MPPQITCASALPGKTGNTKIAFFTRCIGAFSEFNQSLHDFFNPFESRLILMLLYDFLNLVINAFSLGLFGGMFQDKGGRDRCSSWTVLHTQSTSALSSGFPLSHGNAEALEVGNKASSDFLLSQKSSRSDRVCQDYSKSKVGRFLRHSIDFSSGLYFSHRRSNTGMPSQCALNGNGLQKYVVLSLSVLLLVSK